MTERSQPLGWGEALSRALKIQALLCAILVPIFLLMNGPDNPVPWVAFLLLQFPSSLLLFPAWGLFLEAPDWLAPFTLPLLFGPMVLLQFALLTLVFRKPWRRGNAAVV